MDDDGLLLNFSTGGPARKPKAASHYSQQRDGAKGQRRQSETSAPAPKVLVQPRSDSLALNVEHRGDRTSSSPTKVGRASGADVPKKTNGAPSTSARVATLSGDRHIRTSSASSKPKRGTAVISSLFAGDDALKESVPESQAAIAQADPTNAPSTKSDFTPLHLSSLLVSHLASDKMNNITRPTGIQRAALPFLLSPSAHQRDALLHAQTGSGKTLCYLLPVIQSLLPYCEASWIDRSCLGTMAIILAPTRELARQIYEVAEAICSLHLAGSTAGADESAKTVRRTRWIVPGLLSGGATKNHEKSRLRKGLPLIVATPGRLLDHLRNTAALDVGRLQWLVLDEADRLLQLGFEETLNDILKAIEARRRAACEVQRERMRGELGNQYQGEAIEDADVIDTFGEAWWKHGRRTVLCSATLDEGVQVLAGKSLRDPKVIRSDAITEDDNDEAREEDGGNTSTSATVAAATITSIAAPAQLLQHYVVVPTKQRLIMMVALIRRAIAANPKAKTMVFLSCTDSVDFHLSALAGVQMARGEVPSASDEDDKRRVEQVAHTSQLLPSASLFKLHGALTAQNRQASLKAFAQCKQAAVLFCTSVASRGLDLHVSHVVQLDAPTEKGADEYVHRIGRTARAGERGESWLILLPSEEGCVEHYEAAIGKEKDEAVVVGGATTKPVVQQVDPTAVLRDGFGGSDVVQTQTRATDAQMALERWTVASEANANAARRAYLAHLRAYATHPPSERAIFAIAKLQLGHLAKAFALREAPGEIRAKVQQQQKGQTTKKGRSSTGADGKSAPAMTAAEANKKRKRTEVGADADDDTTDLFDSSTKLQFQRNEDTEARMYAKVRQMGKLHKRAGVLADYGGADEFQIA